MSDFESYDSTASEVKPLESFDGVDVGVVEGACPMPSVEPDRAEIRIVTGPDGAVQGSQVFINGEEVPRLASFTVSGKVGGYWETVIRQVVRDA